MSEWITDRLPDPDDAFEDWVFVMNRGNVELFLAVSVPLGMPWLPIVPPAPYVKPKRWTAEFSVDLWRLVDHREGRCYFVGLGELGRDGGDAAQRIADIYNEVMP
jgi:hypothetical protein